MKKIILVAILTLSVFSSFSQRVPNGRDCEISCCIPPSIKDGAVIRDQFILQIVDGRNSTYKVVFSPQANFINMIRQFDEYNASQLVLCGYSAKEAALLSKSVNQFILREITNPAIQNATGEQILNTHIHNPSNYSEIDVFYNFSTTGDFTPILKPNIWYIISYGMYWDNNSPFTKCGYNGASFAIKISDTGNMKMALIQTKQAKKIDLRAGELKYELKN